MAFAPAPAPELALAPTSLPSGVCEDIDDDTKDALLAFCITLLLKVVLESNEAVSRPIGDIWGNEEESAGGSGSTGGMRGSVPSPALLMLLSTGADAF